MALLGALMREFQIEIDAEGLTNSIMIIGGIVGTVIFRWKATKIHSA